MDRDISRRDFLNGVAVVAGSLALPGGALAGGPAQPPPQGRSYEDYLLKVVRVDRQAYWFYLTLGRGVFGVGADATPALFAWQMGGAGFAGLELDPLPGGLLSDLPGGQHGRQKPGGDDVHFPDGNATLARLLVRRLIPDAVPGTTQEDVGMAHVNYAVLDRPGNDTRIRLSSTVLNVRHIGDAASAKEVLVSYSPAASTSGKLYQVRARACIMACWNMFIPYLIPELPVAQKTALSDNVKVPLVYTSVFLRNWKSFQKLGLANVECPTMYHDSVALTEACELGKLQFARTREDPIALALTHFPVVPGLPRKAQHRAGRAHLHSECGRCGQPAHGCSISRGTPCGRGSAREARVPVRSASCAGRRLGAHHGKLQ